MNVDVLNSGPLKAGSSSGWGVPMAENTRFADGFQVLNLEGAKAAVITKVSVVGGSPGLLFLGARIVGPHREVAETTEYRGWPPTSPSIIRESRPAVGAVLQPNPSSQSIGYELLIGYERSSSQLAARRSVMIDYRVGDRPYRVTLLSRFVACPPTMSPAECSRASNRLFPSG